MMKAALLLLLRGYKYLISPLLGQNCRFYPSCSEYAAQAISEYGAAKGLLMSGKRLCKCHPWHEGGVDLVPPKATVKPKPKPNSIDLKKEQNCSYTDSKVSNQLENSASASKSGAVSTQLPSS